MHFKDQAYLATQLSASALSIAGTYFYGNKTMAGPILGIAAQVPWWLIMDEGSLWGLLPVNTVMLVAREKPLEMVETELKDDHGRQRVFRTGHATTAVGP